MKCFVKAHTYFFHIFCSHIHPLYTHLISPFSLSFSLSLSLFLSFSLSLFLSVSLSLFLSLSKTNTHTYISTNWHTNLNSELSFLYKFIMVSFSNKTVIKQQMKSSTNELLYVFTSIVFSLVLKQCPSSKLFPPSNADATYSILTRHSLVEF